MIGLYEGTSVPKASAVKPLGKATFSIPKGKTVPLKVKLTKKGTSKLKKKGKLKITAVVTTTDEYGRKTVVKRKYTLKVKRK